MAVYLRRMTGDELLSDEEWVFRRVPRESVPIREGRYQIHSEAFNDRWKKPSVDRAAMKSAVEAQMAPTDGICTLHVAVVRSITTVVHQGTNKPYQVDVLPRPIKAGNPENEPVNLAHSQVEVDPEFENASRFKKLKDALSRLAGERGWVIEPT